MDEARDGPPPRPRGGPWRVDIVVVVAAIAALGLGSWWFGFGSDPGSGSRPTPSASRSTADAAGLAELERVCEEPRPSPAAPAYRGEGPHRFAAFDGDTTSVRFGELTPDWVTEDPAKAELVVCFDAKPGETVNTCELHDNDGDPVEVKVLAVDYTFRIFEARTGELLDEASQRADDPACPTSVLMDPEASGWSVESPVDDDAVRDIVEPWVTRTVD